MKIKAEYCFLNSTTEQNRVNKVSEQLTASRNASEFLEISYIFGAEVERSLEDSVIGTQAVSVLWGGKRIARCRVISPPAGTS